MIKFINREQIYREVWITPLTKLAPVYNLSTYEMKRLCDTFCIPLPRAGHWQKIAFGKTVPIPPLPAYEKYKSIRGKFNLLNKDNRATIAEETVHNIVPVIRVKKNLTKPHSITEKTRDALKRSSIDEYGMKKPWKEGFDLRVSKVNERRALLVIDALCKWFEKNDIKINHPFKESTTTEVIIDGQHIRIKIEEKSKLTAKNLTKGWGDYEYYTREYTPTGELSLVIDNYCFGCGIRKIWRDGKISKIEEKLGEYVATIFKHAEWEKQKELRLKADEVRREKQRRIQRYNEECQKYEKQMIEDLERQSNDLMKSKQVKAYIVEVERLAKEQYKDGNYPTGLIDWINWAKKHIKELNPLSKGLPIYQKAKDVVKSEDIM